MSPLRRALPLFASLTVHGAVFALLLAQAVVPAFGSALGDAGDELGEDDAETLDEYLARAEDDLDFGTPAVDLVGIQILPDELATAPAAAPKPEPKPEPKPAPAPKPEPELAQAAPTEPPVEAAPVEAPPVQPVVEAAPAELAAVEAPEAPEAPEAVAEATPPAAEEVAAVEAAVADMAAEIRAEAAKARPRRQGHSPLRPGRAAQVAKDADPDDGITRTGRTSWSVERDVVDYYATHIPELMKLGSVGAHRGKDGKLNGFRVKVKKGSLLKETGLRSGDVVRSVNGIEVHDLIGALGAYFKLRKAKHIEVILLRNGRELTYSYDLV